jgi:hypothetical protein
VPANAVVLCQLNYNAWQAGLWIKSVYPACPVAHKMVLGLNDSGFVFNWDVTLLVSTYQRNQ